MKTRTEILPPLHPNTIAALVGKWTVHFADDGSVTGTVEHADLSSTYQARNVCAELVELVLRIRKCKGDDRLGELYQESLEKLQSVASIALAVDDAGFPAQLEFAMKYARNPATPRRRAVFKAWRHLTSGITTTNHKTGESRTMTKPSRAEFHALAESFFGGEITPRTLDDDVAGMKLDGIQKRPRGKPRKAG